MNEGVACAAGPRGAKGCNERLDMKRLRRLVMLRSHFVYPRGLCLKGSDDDEIRQRPAEFVYTAHSVVTAKIERSGAVSSSAPTSSSPPWIVSRSGSASIGKGSLSLYVNRIYARCGVAEVDLADTLA